MRGVDPYDALMDMLIEEGDDAPRLMWATQSFTEDRGRDVHAAISRCAVISDTAALAPYGASQDQLFSLSGYGWAARFLQYYVRDRQVLPLPRRSAGSPRCRPRAGPARPRQPQARQLGRRDGIRSGANREPLHGRQPARLSHAVSPMCMVNGEFAMRDGARTDNNGRVLREFKADRTGTTQNSLPTDATRLSANPTLCKC